MVHVNYKSDFILREAFRAASGNLLPLPEECDFVITYRTSPYSEFVASRVGGIYTNCAPMSDGKLLVMLNSHGLGRGYLTRTAHFDFHNDLMPDNYLSIVSPENTGVELWEHQTECHGVIECDVLMNYIQGEPGNDGQNGKDGKDGKDGLPPIIQNGQTTSSDPESQARLTFTHTGQTSDGNPIYRVDAIIPQGKRGEGLNIKDFYNTLEELQAAHPTGNPGDMYLISGALLYIWDARTESWAFAGNIKGEKGDTGEKGAKGDTGPRGAQGPQGPAGPAGASSTWTVLQVSANVITACADTCYQYETEHTAGYTITPAGNTYLKDGSMFMVETKGNTPIRFETGGSITEIYLAQSMSAVSPQSGAWMSYTCTRFGSVLKVNRELYIKQ